MKKISLFISGLLIISSLNGQVFNTGETLKSGVFSLGVEPVVYTDGNANFNLFVHGGYGIKSGIDFGLKAGFGAANYFGADLEWALAKRISLTTGIHHYKNDLGLDGTLLFTIPVRKDARLFAGADMDVVFADEVQFPFWIPIGIDLGLSSRMALILEGEIALTNVAYNLFGGGLVFYF